MPASKRQRRNLMEDAEDMDVDEDTQLAAPRRRLGSVSTEPIDLDEDTPLDAPRQGLGRVKIEPIDIDEDTPFVTPRRKLRAANTEQPVDDTPLFLPRTFNLEHRSRRKTAGANKRQRSAERSDAPYIPANWNFAVVIPGRSTKPVKTESGMLLFFILSPAFSEKSQI